MSEQLELFTDSRPRKGEYVVPEDAQLLACRSCGLPMVFCETENGRAIPLSVKTIEEREGVKYAMPHFADCPQAKKWSKR